MTSKSLYGVYFKIGNSFDSGDLLYSIIFGASQTKMISQSREIFFEANYRPNSLLFRDGFRFFSYPTARPDKENLNPARPGKKPRVRQQSDRIAVGRTLLASFFNLLDRNPTQKILAKNPTSFSCQVTVGKKT